MNKNSFDQEVGQGSQGTNTNQDLASQQMQQQQAQQFNSAKNGGAKIVNRMRGKNSPTGGAGKKASELAGKATKKVTQATSKAIKKVGGQVAGKLGGAMIKVAGPYIIAAVGGFTGIALAAQFAGVVVDNEYSRNSDANYQHSDKDEGNKVMNTNVGSKGNVYYNPENKRYEFVRGKMPTEANKLYYVYYAVMANQSRWFVNYEKQEGLVPGKDGAGTKDNPYFKPVKAPNDKVKYTLDGYLFNQNVLDKVGLRPINAGEKLTIDKLIDEKAAKAVRKISLNVNLVYYLNSTLNGANLGTGKNQMFFAEQFIKPTYHDELYNFKALTEYRDMTADEKEKYKSKAHGGGADGELEKEFQSKYEKWGKYLDEQNKARGGNNGSGGDGSGGDGGDGSWDGSGSGGGGSGGGNTAPANADGIDDPILKKAVEWGLSKTNKGIGYSSPEGRLGPNTYDCSGFITTALDEAGFGGVKGLSTVGMLQASNALGQSGTKFKQVDLNTAKKGTIVVVGGLEGAGPYGHVFFLLEDFHGPTTRILDCNGVQGVSQTSQFQYGTGVPNPQPIALVPGQGDPKSGGSSDSGGGDGGVSHGTAHNTSGDYSMETPNTYKDKISTGKLEAQSRVFDPLYNPTIINNVATKETLNFNVWREGDFYLGENSVKLNKYLDIQKFAANIGNSQFKPNGGPIRDSDGKAKEPDDNKLYDYYTYRTHIVQWSLLNKINPAFVVAAVDAFSHHSTRDFLGNKFNFLEENSAVELNGKKSSGSDSKSDKDNKDKDKDNNKDKEKDKDKDKDKEKEKESENKEKDDKNKDKDKDKKDKDKKENDYADPGNYGADYYSLKNKYNSVGAGMRAVIDKLKADGNDDLNFDQNMAKEKFGWSDIQWQIYQETFQKVGGHGKIKMEDDDVKDVRLYTYNGTGPTDKKALGVIAIDGETDETKIDGHKKYYKKSVYTPHGPVAVPNSSNGSKYAVKRDDSGDNVEMTTGVWDHGLGSIFKIARMEYAAYEIGIDKHGDYYVVNKDGLMGWFFNTKQLTKDTQYQILGVTTPFGTINLGNKIYESQYEIEQVIEKLKKGGKLTGQEKAILNKHREPHTIKVNGKQVSAGANNFLVSTKPIIEEEPPLEDSNGAQYIIDYLQHYESWIPNITENKLDVVQRWKAMNDANASTQEAQNKVASIFASLIKDNSGSNDSLGESTAGGATGISSEEQDKIAKEIFKVLTEEYGFSGEAASGVLSYVKRESSFVPTAQNPGGGVAGLFQWGGFSSGLNGSRITAEGSIKAGDVTSLTVENQLKLLRYELERGSSITSGFENHPGGRKMPFEEIGRLTDPAQAAIEWSWSFGGVTKNDAQTKVAQIKADADAFNKQYNTSNVKADSSKLSKISSKSGGGGDGAGGSSAPGLGSDSSSKVQSNWGDGSGFANKINNFLDSVRGLINSIFGGSDSWDPTMFATKPQLNEEHTLYEMKEDGKTPTGKSYGKKSVYINGVDAYKWSHFENKLSSDNANMVVRQFVAAMETRTDRPVYYDEVYDTFTPYEMSRIIEENYKLQMKDLFKPTVNISNTEELTGGSGADLFDGESIADSKIDKAFGWVKKGNDVEFNPGYTFNKGAGTKVKALENGKVVFVGNTEYGKTIIIRSAGNRQQLVYAGLGNTNFSVDDEVNQGDVIGTVGTDGKLFVGGLQAEYDASSGVPKRPNDFENTNGWVDIYGTFGIPRTKMNEVTSKANGYDANKFTTSKPSASDFGNTSEVKIGDVAPKRAPSSGGKQGGATQQAIIDAAMAQIGRIQDCTMLVTNSLKAVGINFHDWPVGYKSLGHIVSREEAVPGDLVYYVNGGTGLAHIGVYAGGDKAVHGGWLGNQTVLGPVDVGSGPEFIRVDK